MKLSGVVPALGTPLGEGDCVDEAGLRRLVRYVLDAGVDGIFANGTMGGFAFLTDEEQSRAVATVVSEVGGVVPVVAGVGETSTRRAIRKAKEMSRLGPDYLALLPPFYFHATQQHLISYFSEVSEAVDLPVVLYDNPRMTKNCIEPETVSYLRERFPNVVGIKVSNQDCVNLQELLYCLKDDAEFSVLTGSEFLLLVGLRMGCDGGVGGVYNVCPRIPVELYDAFCNGDFERADELQRKLIETWQIFGSGNLWGSFDEALRYLGICERATGAPYVTSLSDQEKARVHEILDRQVKPHLLHSSVLGS